MKSAYSLLGPRFIPENLPPTLLRSQKNRHTDELERFSTRPADSTTLSHGSLLTALPFRKFEVLRSLSSTLITDGNLPVFPPELKTLLRVSSKGQKHEPARVRSGFEPHLPASSHPSPPGEPRSSHVNYPGFPSSVVKEGKKRSRKHSESSCSFPSLPSPPNTTLTPPSFGLCLLSRALLSWFEVVVDL